ncbi:CoA ester lyase [Kaistia algarum]|uniref:HpcH/HpaI aldolase/citrate lyase family protein n=1 Tax=Kaistia algarum TaxID=2083279 RepID=UPI000CE756EA|nr:CoA ester lyase [Kaistia algarum]MCX5514227.1 CoA ester lyase [Kaistia algarum]PPE77208.1 CoA ester lyase [Kaistia algarum]
MKSAIPRRTALYVPGSNPRALDKATGLDADVVILDLEDAVAPEAKSEARARVASRLGEWVGQPGAPEWVVRINGLSTPFGRDDLAAIVRAAPDAILLPKVSVAADIERLRACIVDLGGVPERTRLWAMIETPRAVLDPLAIVAAAAGEPRLEALVLGLNDLSQETGTRQIRGRGPMLPWMMSTLAAARVAGLAILDGVYTDLADMAGFTEECAMARDCGFDGKTVIHPSQIAPANDAFSPTASEISDARQIVDAFADPENAGRGVLTVGGKMVERLHGELAARTLSFAAVIDSRTKARRKS